MFGALFCFNLMAFSEVVHAGVDYISDGQTTEEQQQVTNQKKLKISGIVKDTNGEPVIGATIMESGTSNGVVTNMDGNFTMDVASNGVLKVSYIGYTEQEVYVGGKSFFNIILVEDTKLLDEVVVIGYGTVKRRDLTGAVASVKSEDITANPVSNVAQALQGRLAGVNVTSQDGRPGATISVRVRGGGSITQSNEPLYVVDGLPVGGISDIPASEIESIDVLKDASSTAIYGARGANGVILVTTKGGKQERVRVSYEGYVQARTVADKLETLSAQDYVLNSWSYAASRGTANKDAVEKYFGLGSNYGNHYADYANVKAHDYTDDVLRTAWAHSHYITISGGNESTKISSTIGFIDEEGIKINSDYNRMNGSFKLQQKLSKRLNLDFDVRYTESNSSGGKDNGAATAYTYRPIDNPLGGVHFSEVASGFSFGIANIDDKHNPVELINDITSKSLSRSLRASGALSWEIIDGLIARSEVTMSRGSSKSSYYENGYTNGDKRATLSRGLTEGLHSVSTLNYSFDLGSNHVFSVLLGNEVSKSKSESSRMDGRGYPDTFDYKKTMGLIHTATYSYSSTNSIGVPSHSVSFFGRANYTLMDRYLFTATFRADGSSKFAQNNRWGYFPAGAFAWRVFDEPFMESTKDWLSNLKLRLSYGTSGADNISSNLWRETWSSLGLSSNHTPINGELISFYRPDGLLANQDLKWETTISRNLGIDFGILDNRINGSIELYWNTTKDLLMAVPVDNTTGYSYQYQNFGQTSNRGIEFSVNADIIKTKDFRFNMGVIYNYNRNKLDKLDNADQYLYSSNWASSALVPTNDFMFIVGKPIGQVRGFISEGVYTVDDFNYTNGQYVLKENTSDLTKAITATYMHPFNIPSGQTAFPGAPKFRDVDESGKIDMDDATNLGALLPSHTGSFQLNFNYKNFDLSSNFTWVAGGKIYNVAAMGNMQGNEFVGIGQQRSSKVRNAYKAYSVDASGNLYPVTNPDELRILNAGAKYELPYHQSGITSSEWIEDGSYLRLQTLTIGYTLPKSLLQKIGVSNARFYLTGANLFTITGYSGLDPEVSVTPTGRSGYSGNLSVFPTPNMDNGAYPRARTFTLGANITF
ncbi:TonB-dependent receptor [Bacteroides sp. 214]|uniref:SusC/RagA family TonB-linked outer membrane protein n=1 Tax=Bacteroides sp. 214 TaxID=2302935 RepID=UPI001EF17314|nr:TonB-dependent receptor [Bacteroides sp. 214]